MKSKTPYQKNTLELNLNRIFRRVQHHLIIIICIILVCAAVGYVDARYFTEPTYRATADMLVNNSTGTTVTVVSNNDLSAASSLVSTYSVMMTSHTVLGKIIDKFDLDMTHEELINHISVGAVDATQVMRITVEMDNAELAFDIVSYMVELAPGVILGAEDGGSVRTVDDPYTNGKPVAPSKTRYTALGAIVGVVLCGVFIVLRDLLDRTFRTEEDLRTMMDLEVLGVIPVDKTKEKKRRKGSKKKDG